MLGPVVLLIGLVGLVTGYLLPFAYGDDSLYDRAFGPGGYGIAFWNAYPSDSSLADTIYFGLAAPVPILAVLLAGPGRRRLHARATGDRCRCRGLVIALAWSVGLIVMFLIVEVIGNWSGDLVDVLRQLTPGGIILFLASSDRDDRDPDALRTELTVRYLPELRNRGRRHRGLLPDLRPGDRPGRRDGDAGGPGLAGAGRPASPHEPAAAPAQSWDAAPADPARTEARPQAPPPATPPPPAAATAGPSVSVPLTMPVTLSGWLIGVGAVIGGLGVVVGLFDGVLNPIELLLLLGLIGIAVAVFFPSVLASFPNLRLATLVVALIGFGLSLDRLGFGGAGAGELLLFLGTAAAAMGAIILELGRDQPLGPVR